ncbi:hypothetical protein Cgig2_031100 [Carnegiea gigantea]|uniref:Uncharacterized protein n=1 Tax=Carnegiea gigantea TaxID=171969 RepID=A0A9Q1GW27_9CARY|nr:hypothetical protein Cgig2_031100 [Carnegiea gigantea]
MEGAAFKVTPQNHQAQNRLQCSHCQKQCYKLVGYPANWGTRSSNRHNSGGLDRSSMTFKNWGNDKSRGTATNEGLAANGTGGGGGYRGGSSNYATMVPDLAFGGMRMEERGGQQGRDSRGVSQEMGFAGFTQFQTSAPVDSVDENTIPQTRPIVTRSSSGEIALDFESAPSSRPQRDR